MSATPTDDGSRYENPETKAQLDAARQKLETKSTVDEIETAATAVEAKSEMATEDQPGRNLPNLTETHEVEFRGEPFEFEEAGRSLLDAVSGAVGDDADPEEGLEVGEHIYTALNEKCVRHVPTGELTPDDYWDQYDLQHPDTDGVIDLFHRLLGEANPASDVDADAAEAVDEFRGE